ncbi:protein kinase domain-containing protein [Haliangium sp.]|uniref:serine/threonine-protein kinase n=1 Tax=Haliangium sp. TaxID=2663208 RepID=UPI003D0BFEA5
MHADGQAARYARPRDPLLGATVGERYFIETKLGDGGMGTVYLARHIALEREVALKVLHPHYCDKPDIVERFLREARAASRIRHENVVDITDFGSTPEGVVFFAMEVLEGHDLHEAVDVARGPAYGLPWSRARKIFLQICAALEAAHEHGIVHRDLKPENIFLVEWAGHKDVVKLLDFGIAKLDEASSGGRRLTRTGTLFGTPEYMAPEQARGGDVDHRADIYAMGCLLYQLIVGEVPFAADDYVQVLTMHLSAPPPAISADTFAAVGAPLGIEGVIARAMAKEVDDRFPTIADMARAVRAVDKAAKDLVITPRALRGDQTPAPRPLEELERLADADAGSAAVAPAVSSQVAAAVSTPVVGTEAAAPTPPSPTTSVDGEGGRSLRVVRTPAPRRGPRWGAIVLAVVLVAGAAVAGVLVLPDLQGAISASSTEQADSPATPAPAQVTIVLASDPAQASIYDRDGRLLGRAPVTIEAPASQAPRRYRFRHEGYQDTWVEIVPERDVHRTVVLTANTGEDTDGDADQGVEPRDDDDSERSDSDRRERRRRDRARSRESRSDHDDSADDDGAEDEGIGDEGAGGDEGIGDDEAAPASDQPESAAPATGDSDEGATEPTPTQPAPAEPAPAEPKQTEPELKNPFGR